MTIFFKAEFLMWRTGGGANSAGEAGCGQAALDEAGRALSQP